MILMISKSCLFEPSHFMMMCFVCAMCVWLTRVFHYYVFLSFFLSSSIICNRTWFILIELHHKKRKEFMRSYVEMIVIIVILNAVREMWMQSGNVRKNSAQKRQSERARERKRKIARPKDSEQKLNEMEWMGTGHHAYTIQLLSMGLLLDGISHIHKWPLRSLNCLIGHCVN